MSRVENEECLEQLWQMQTEGKDAVSELARRVPGQLTAATMENMAKNGLVNLNDDGTRIALTALGEERARKVTRCHRLAERLLYDVLDKNGEQLEAEACEFEHVVAPELVDGICTLLGHPRECPHGNPIPEGECCRKSVRFVESAPRPLTALRVSDRARVAFVRCERDEQMHRLDGLGIRPGVALRLHQTYPTYVIECEGTHIALEEKVADNIHVWSEQ
ncbi:MAG TPA: metal-dependent transcriptional regulator [Sumerlaeia bacterium]|nr:metal-dependent transcriptional regulator [Sumerlaeia bacterium]